MARALPAHVRRPTTEPSRLADVYGSVARSAPTMAAFAASAAIAAQLLWLLHGSFSPAARPSPQRGAAAVAARDADVRVLGSLFGSEKVVSGPGGPAADASGLELTGTIALPDPQAGFGIVRLRGQPDRVYRVGAELPGGARLAAVYDACVGVDVGGSTARLCLPQVATTASPVPVAARVPRAPDPVVESSPRVPQTLEARRAHPINVPSSVVTEVLRPRPMVVDERVIGYAVSSAEDSSPIAGLPRMAVIRSINGVQLTDGVVAAKMFDALPGAGQATFVIQTAHGEESLTLDVSSLAALARRMPGSP